MKRVFAFIGFSVAITLIILNIISFSYVPLIISIAVVLFAASLLIKATRQAKVLPIVFGSVIFACLIFMVVNVSAVIPAKTLDKCTASAQFQIVNIPQYNVNSDSYTYVVRTKSIDKSGAPQSIKVKLKTDKEIDADYYDLISAKLNFYNNYNTSFDSYGDYGDGIYICARLVSIDSVSSDTEKPFNYYLISLREQIFDIINSEFKGDTAGISIALLTGDKSYLSQSFQENMRICGLSHFFAVSGFHISIICLGIYNLLKLLRLNKGVNTIITIITMVIYCGVADFSKSSIRACIMLAVMLISRLFNTKADNLNSLGLAVLIICFNPFAVTDVSAVLTVSAMLGILAVYVPISKGLNENKTFEKLEKTSLMSICILVSLIPAMYIFFGSISIGSIFTNIIIEPLIIALMISVIIFCLVSNIAFFAFIPKLIITSFSKLLILIVNYISDEYSFVFINISGGIFGVSLAAIFIFMGICLIVNKELPLKLTSAFVVVMIIGSAACYYQESQTAYVCICESGMMVIYDKDYAVVIGMDSRYDKNKADSIINDRKTLYIDCDSYVDDIQINDSYSEKLNKNISILLDDEIIIAQVLDKTFEIHYDYVIINENVFSRNLYNDGTEDGSVTISFVNNSALYIRRGDSG